MVSKTNKILYSLFFLSFGIWFTLLFYVCFPNGTLAIPIRFQNSLTLASFMVSAGIAALSCGIIGLIYMGLNFELVHRIFLQRSKRHDSIRQISPALVANVQRDVVDTEVEEVGLDISVLLLAEEEATHKTI